MSRHNSSAVVRNHTDFKKKAQHFAAVLFLMGVRLYAFANDFRI